MQEISNIIKEKYKIRHTLKQKREFREKLIETFEEKNIQWKLQTGRALINLIVSNQNIVVGDVVKANIIITAHYDTPINLFFPNRAFPNSGFRRLTAQLPICLLVFGLPVMVGFITCNILLGLNLVIICGLIFIMMILFGIGVPNENNYNDNTSGVITLLEMILDNSIQGNNNAAFIFFDNEEKGLLGSRLFKRKCKKVIKEKPIINLDCVSEGNHILIVQNDRLPGNKTITDNLRNAFKSTDEKHVILSTSKKSKLSSDHKTFKNGVGIMALNEDSKKGLYLDKIHTNKDCEFDKRNIEFIKTSLIKLIQEISKK